MVNRPADRDTSGSMSQSAGRVVPLSPPPAGRERGVPASSQAGYVFGPQFLPEDASTWWVCS